MPLTSFEGLIPSIANPSLRDRGIPSFLRLKPTRFAADATQLMRRGLTDGTNGDVTMRSVSFCLLGAACWDEERVGDMKFGDPALMASLYLLANGSRPFFLLPKSVFMVPPLRVSIGATMINRN